LTTTECALTDCEIVNNFSIETSKKLINTKFNGNFTGTGIINAFDCTINGLFTVNTGNLLSCNINNSSTLNGVISVVGSKFETVNFTTNAITKITNSTFSGQCNMNGEARFTGCDFNGLNITSAKKIIIIGSKNNSSTNIDNSEETTTFLGCTLGEFISNTTSLLLVSNCTFTDAFDVGTKGDSNKIQQFNNNSFLTAFNASRSGIAIYNYNTMKSITGDINGAKNVATD